MGEAMIPSRHAKALAHRSRRDALVLTAAVASIAVIAACSSDTASGGSGEPSRQAAATEGAVYRPFFGVYPAVTELGYTDLPAVMKDSGAGQVILSAITAKGNACEPAWGNFADNYGVQKAAIQKWINEIGAEKVTISFGGNLDTGKYLDEACGTAADLAAQYQALIDYYGVKRFDFNIEGNTHSGQTNTAANKKRVEAMTSIIATNPGVQIGFTVEKWNTSWPPEPSQGASTWELENVKEFVAAGIKPSWVNLMVLHTSSGIAGSQEDSVSSYVGAMIAQLTDQYLKDKMTKAEITAIAGVTASNNEPSSNKPFTPADAAKVKTVADTRGWGYLSPWIVDQDYPCAINGTSTDRDPALCSKTVDQSETGKYQFSRVYLGK